MAVVVEQTIPFPPSSLDLENPKRWDTLFPLIRPSVTSTRTPKGQTILIDSALARRKGVVHIAAIGTLGNFSSKLLDEQNVTAIVTEQRGAGLLTAQDVQHALSSAGVEARQGVVVVRTGKKRDVQSHSPELLEVETNGELEADHLLHLLGNATETARTSIHHISGVVKAFVKGSSTAHSRFHVEKVEGNPAVVHVDGAKGFEKARHAVERDLKHVLQEHQGQVGEGVTFSVHLSDVNGLSRLENCIVAGEIGRYFGESRSCQWMR
jgi:hypothetical protein